MSDNPCVIVVIPARGGSKGIPRKNLRPLNGQPLISYAIRTALASSYKPYVCVSSDDAEILAIAEHYGAVPLLRPEELAGDSVTLDPVIFHAVQEAGKARPRPFDLVVTMQPTSPLLRVSSLDSAIGVLVANPSLETVISGKEDSHLSWRIRDGAFIPNYESRLNRQLLPKEFRETGGFFVSRASCVRKDSRIGDRVSLFLLDEGESIDIDDYDDWNLCEYHMKRKRILFVVTGHRAVGLGHVYNSLLLANEILGHEVQFLVDSASDLAYDKIRSQNYPVTRQTHQDILEDIRDIKPDVVISDCLDTERGYVLGIKALGCKAINFEDLGPGASEADLVINAIYPERSVRANHYYGQRYFVLRDDFFRSRPRAEKNDVREVLVSFGGTDPLNNTRHVLEEILPSCRAKGIHVTVIAGFGYGHYASLAEFEDVEILRNVSNIADYMSRADMAFTAAGRTTYELASLGVPTIVIAQNEREMTHFFASPEYGFVNLGLGSDLVKGKILTEFEALIADGDLRNRMRELMLNVDLRQAKKRVMRLIENVLQECS